MGYIHVTAHLIFRPLWNVPWYIVEHLTTLTVLLETTRSTPLVNAPVKAGIALSPGELNLLLFIFVLHKLNGESAMETEAQDARLNYAIHHTTIAKKATTAVASGRVGAIIQGYF